MLFQSHIKSAFRGLSKNRFYTLVNLVGLISGITACLLIVGYINYESSYDTHFSNSGELFRVDYHKFDHGKQAITSAKTPSRLAQIAPSDLPQVTAACRVYPEPCLIRFEDKKLASQKVLWVDASFLEVFQGILLQGDPSTALKGPDKMVVTESTAKALFGNRNPIGQQLKVNEGMPFEITGVVKDPPAGTHMKFDYLTSISTFTKYGWMPEIGDWYGNWVYTYMTTKPGITRQQLQQSIDRLAEANFEFLKKSDQNAALEVQPMQSIHLHSHQPDELYANGDIKYLYVIGGVGIAILIMIWINFVNLSTALSLTQVRQIGVRKTFGATKRQLIAQKITESAVINLAALALSILLVVISHSFFEQLIGIKLNFSIIGNPQYWLIITGIFIVGIGLSALYPAWVIASFSPIQALKSQITQHSGSHTVRQLLITVQFAAAIFLTLGSVVVYQQIKYMQHQDLGANMDHLLVMRGPTTLNAASDDSVNVLIKINRYDHFRKDLKQYAFVQNVTSTFHVPGEDIRHKTDEVSREDTGEKTRTTFSIGQIDEEFFPAYGVKILAGKNFERDLKQQHHYVILNEEAVRTLGYASPENAVGKIIRFNSQTWRIQGVAHDFHQKALTESVKPMIFINRHPHEFGYYIVKFNTDDVRSAVNQVKSKWLATYPDDPFYMFFADDYFNKQYERDEQFGRLFSIFTILSILIANLGLIAITSFAIARRSKEIGIRKVLGANMQQIIFLMFRGFLSPISIAVLIGLPVGWWLLSRWLENYAYHISISPFWLILCAGAIFLISLVNVGYYVSRLTLNNPSEVLRDE